MIQKNQSIKHSQELTSCEQFTQKQTIFQTFQHPQKQPIFITNQQVQIKKSPHLQSYNLYFLNVFPIVQLQFDSAINHTQSMIQHKIIIINQNAWNHGLISFTKPLIVVAGYQYEGLVINYDIVIATFKLQVKLFNSLQNCPQNVQQIGKGAYGSIIKLNCDDLVFVAKRINFIEETQIFQMGTDKQNWKIQPNQKQINLVLCEFAIYKICSFFKIGPRILSIYDFDLICFQDAIQFYMEECQPMTGNLTYSEQIATQIKICLRLLHKLKIIHKDLKTDNILFSKHHNKYVISDFGISHSIQQQIGFLTKTYKEGTMNYMSDAMRKLDRQIAGYIDLYFNDLCGLQISLRQIKRLKVQFQRETRQNRIVEFYVCIKLIKSFMDESIENILDASKTYTKLNKNDKLLKRIKELGKSKLLCVLQKINSVKIFNSNNIYLQIVQFMLQQCLNLPINKQNNINYMIRIHGLTYYLYQYLQTLNSNNQKIKKLILKLQSSTNLSQINYSDIIKLQILGLESRIEPIMHRQLLYYQSLGNYTKIFQLGIDILDRKLKLKQNYQYCRKLIEKISNIIHELEQQPTIFIIYTYISHLYQLQQKVSLISKIFQLICTQSLIYQKKIMRLLIHICINYLSKIQSQYLIQFIAKNYPNEYNLDLGHSFYQNNQFQQALKHYLYALNQPNFNIRSLNGGHFLNNIGMCYYNQCKYDIALFYYFKSMSIIQKYVNPNHLYIAIILNNIATCYQLKNQYGESLKYYTKVKDIKHITIGQKHPSTATTYNNIGLCYSSLHNYQIALQYYQKALKITKQTKGMNNLDIVSILSNIAVTYYITQNEKLYQIQQLILKIMKKLNKQIHPWTANAHNHIGIFLQQQGRFQQSIKCFQDALKIRLAIFGQNHLDVASSYTNLGICQSNSGQYKQSIKNFLKAIQIHKTILGNNALQLGGPSKNLARIYRKLNKFPKAIIYYYYSILPKIKLRRFQERNTIELIDELISCIDDSKCFYLGIYILNKLSKLGVIKQIEDSLQYYNYRLYMITGKLRYRKKMNLNKLKIQHLKQGKYIQYLIESISLGLQTAQILSYGNKNDWIRYLFCRNILLYGKIETKKQQKIKNMLNIIICCKKLKNLIKKLNKNLPDKIPQNIQNILTSYLNKLQKIKKNNKQ